MKNTFLFLFVTILIIMGCKQRTETPKSLKNSSIKINTELVTRLKKMIELDQYASGVPQGDYQGDWQGWFKYRDTISKKHKIQLEEILNNYGYPGFSMVGEEVSEDYFLMAQHCDFDVAFQQKVLEKLTLEVKNGNARGSNLGFLTDRININLDKPQIYGTQLDYNIGKCIAFAKNGILDSINVNTKRQLLQMEPYETYLNKMLQMHFEMNKEHYLKIGIKEPKYY